MICKIIIDEKTLDLIDMMCKRYKINKNSYAEKIQQICNRSLKELINLHDRLIGVIENTFSIIETYCPHIIDQNLEITRDILEIYHKLKEEMPNSKQIK